MIKCSFYLTKGQRDFLKKLHTLDSSFDKLSLSEHIRRAIDEYIEKKNKKL